MEFRSKLFLFSRFPSILEGNLTLDETPRGIKMTIYNDINELNEVFKATSNTIRDVDDIFQQGDYRYTDPWSSIIVAGFIDNNAIKIDKEKIRWDEEPSKEELGKIRPPQQFYKFIGRNILEEKGCQFIAFEAAFCGGKVDILAEKSSTNEAVAVECCSCRISKAIDYLKRENTILWIISRVEIPLSTESTLYIIRRDWNWNKFMRIYQNYQKNQLNKVTDLLNSL